MTDPHADTSTVMPAKERAAAIARANRALKALTEHPRATRKQLGTARERLNDCHRLAEPSAVWEKVLDIEASAAALYGVPDVGEPRDKAVRRWVSQRGSPGPAKLRRPRQIPKN